MKKYVIPIFLIQYLFSQTGYDVATAIDSKAEPKDMKSDLTMVLTNSKGKTRSSIIRSVSKDGGEKQIIWFLSPADDKGVAFLKIEHDGKDDEMRLWLPAFKKVRRIKSSNKGDAFMGSDMSYEDMTNRNLEEFTYELAGEETIDGKECHILISKPKPELRSTYSQHRTWVTIDDNIVLKEESYDRSGKLLKKKDIKSQKVKEYNTPVEIYVENVQKHHSTRLTFEGLELDTGVEDDLFQEKNLKRLPQ